MIDAVNNLRPDQLKQVLLSSALPVSARGWNDQTGFGVVNAASAFALLHS